MEPEVVKTERRGRKRKRKDGQGADKTAKKTAVETRSKVFVGRYVKKEFDGNGVFLGKIVSYDTGLYRVDYEDGDCEDLESGEVKAFIIGDKDMDDDFHRRKKALDEYILKKYAKDEVVRLDGAANKVEAVRSDGGRVGNNIELANAFKVETVRSDGGGVGNGVELANADKVESSIRGGAFELSGAQPEVDSESSSDVSDYEQSGDPVEVERPPVPPPPQLPPSSGNFGVSEEHVSYLLSVYSFLRSFSVCLFLSPFGLDEFVGALNCSTPNALLDAIHVALLRALKSHVEILSSEGSELASKCLRSMDWSLLDSLTWPVFILQYLMTMRYAEGPEWKAFYVSVLEKDYYTLSAGRKLTILQLLCDDALCSAELRAEIDMREGIEVGPDPDGVLVFADESIPRRVQPSSSNREAVKDIAESHMKTLPSTANSFAAKATGLYTGIDVDEDGNVDECRLCGMDGTLLCCDGCPSAYHTRCIGVNKMCIPEGAWYCPECAANRTGPNVTRVTTLRGAEFFGIDPYEQVFLGSCDHLLVMKASKSSELHIRYYSPVDIQKVLHTLTCSAEYRTLYLGICNSIMRYWEIPEHISSLADSFGTDKFLPNKMVDGEYSIPSTLLAKESSNVQDVIDTGNGNGVAEYNSKDVIAAWREENCKEPGFGKATLDEQVVEGSTQLGNYTNSVGANTETLWSTCSASLQPFSSELNQPCSSGKLSMKNSATCISENGNCNTRSDMNSVCDVSNMSSHSNGTNLLSGGRGHGISADGCLYMGSSFKPQVYVNVYIHGDFAASAAASLAILSSEEKFPSQPQPSSSHRKFMSANYSLQTKAFSLAAKRFYWPNYEKKLVEVPRERCGWCLSCKASVSSRKGCLLNAAASNAIKAAAKILASLRQSKTMEGSLASIATYVMYMEESLRGLTVGPFLNASYRNQWHKQVEEAATLGEIKASLLEFERNIRDIAFSADWIRLVDDMGFENQVAQNAKNAAASTQRRGPGRRGRKPAIILEVTDADGKDLSTNFAWWRGGMLSKHIFQKGILPQRMIKNAARHGGCGKINGVQYVDGVEVPKRSRQFLWRAAVEMSKTASQLALQVRYLDLHVRWNELVRPEQPLQDGKGPETEASAFRNACIVDKKVLGNKISYGVVFENQKHLPSRVLKNILEEEKTGDGKDKYWFMETRIPLYLIKEYEKEVVEVVLTTADKHASTLSNLHKKQLKASGKNIFSFLSQKNNNMGKCLCTLCQLDVPFRYAARCSACQGYCHAQCAVRANIHMGEHVEFIITCKRCYSEKVVTPQNEIVGDSPTSPLLMQGPESQHPATVIKGGKQNGYGRPLEYLNQSSEKNSTTSNRKTNRSGKQNGKRRLSESVDQSSEKKNGLRPPLESSEKPNGIRPPLESSENKLTTNDSNVGKKKSKTKLSWGLIWKTKDPEETGIDFRLKNLLLKGNPNGNLLAPVCHLCTKPYNSDLMYIRCTNCDRWYHAEAVELKESKIMELLGFKCCRCRRIRIPLCPYMDPETRRKLEAKKKPQFKKKKPKNSEPVSNCETNSEQVNELEPDANSAFDTEEAINVEEDDPLYSSPTIEPVNDRHFEVSSPGPGPGSVPKKLQVRRQIKSEKESDGCSANFEPPTGNNPNPGVESSSPVVEWDVSTNGFEDDMMFDYEDLNYEDMEFEPQTYFSFNELLASDSNDPPADTTGDSVAAEEDCNHPEQYQMGITYDEQEPMFSVDSACNVCSLTEPCPDLYCETCGLWIHQHCSPWDDEPPSLETDGAWKCGHCREWR
ncbi:DDT domain-containing protein PTM-like isoform X2 [Cynara cardunculus var. scolymus]|uniref:DDT domain-containing protein PTM-like isoform X2 n=1 Tax=Cynara cardunculus var. scolymus TaxID=59895 RepID=UPI000D62C9A0|nr:DDT domain-containing protein PTM-like isoform X2 [Cynara cardunculus var. scolymus]